MSDVILLEESRPQAYDVALARYLGSINAAVVFHQLSFWSDKSARNDGWFWKSSLDIQYETGLTDKQIRGAITKLKREELIEVRVMRALGAPTRHFRMLKAFKSALGPVDKPRSDSPERANVIRTKGQIGKLRKGKSITVSNTEDYTDSRERFKKLRDSYRL